MSVKLFRSLFANFAQMSIGKAIGVFEAIAKYAVHGTVRK